MSVHRFYLLRFARLATTTLALWLVFSFLGSADLFAQGGGGLGPEAQEFVDNMNRDERLEFHSLNRRERRDYIKEQLGSLSQDATESQDTRESKNAGTDRADILRSVANLEGFVPPRKISQEVRITVGKNRHPHRGQAVQIQKARGAIETGLEPKFIGGADCPEIDSETWAIDYSHKRPWPAIHKGIDIPQPRGTPIRAISDGTVVGKFQNEGNRKGIELMLRHTPEQTGLPFWTYSQYTHLQEMSPLPIGAEVKIGQKIGKTSNTGKMGRRIRRDALHFAILYSRQPEWSNNGRYVAPKEGYWMDPNAFYRLSQPYDSQSLVDLPDDQKKTPVPNLKVDGSFMPPATKRIWPYRCK